MNVVKIIAFIMSLGIDTLMMSVSLGTANLSRPTRLRLAIVFPLAEAGMPLVGLALGHWLGGLIGRWASVAGGLSLLAVAVWFVVEDHDPDAGADKLGLKWSTLIVMALSISVDEAAAGLSIGLLGIPVVLTIALIAVQALLFTLVGLALGARLAPYLGRWTEQLAGVVLGLLGLYILVPVLMNMLLEAMGHPRL